MWISHLPGNYFSKRVLLFGLRGIYQSERLSFPFPHGRIMDEWVLKAFLKKWVSARTSYYTLRYEAVIACLVMVYDCVSLWGGFTETLRKSIQTRFILPLLKDIGSDGLLSIRWKASVCLPAWEPASGTFRKMLHFVRQYAADCVLPWLWCRLLQSWRMSAPMFYGRTGGPRQSVRDWN